MQTNKYGRSYVELKSERGFNGSLGVDIMEFNVVDELPEVGTTEGEFGTIEDILEFEPWRGGWQIDTDDQERFELFIVTSENEDGERFERFIAVERESLDDYALCVGLPQFSCQSCCNCINDEDVEPSCPRRCFDYASGRKMPCWEPTTEF